MYLRINALHAHIKTEYKRYNEWVYWQTKLSHLVVQENITFSLGGRICGGWSPSIQRAVHFKS